MLHLRIEALKETDIIQQEIALQDLWLLKHEDQSFGPFSTKQLTDYTKEENNELEKVLATNLIQNNFKPFYSHPQLQRRKPKLVSTTSLISDNSFYTLHNGQKAGPFTLEELESLLEQSKISYASQISTDDAKTWIKVHEHHHFDRRSRQESKELPFIPDNSILERAIEEGQKALFEEMENENEHDALVGLACQTMEHTRHNYSNPFNKEQTATAKQSKTFQYAGLFVLVIALSFSLFTTNDSNEDTFAKRAKAQIKNTRKVAINNSPRNVRKRVPASVKPIQNRQRLKKKVISRKSPTVEVKRTHTVKREPKRITHFADDFGSIDMETPENKERLERELAGIEEPDTDNEDRLTQDEIEAIELDDPALLEHGQP